MLVYFDTDDIDAQIARVRELGGEAEDKQPVPGMGWTAQCKDPEGNRDRALADGRVGEEANPRCGRRFSNTSYVRSLRIPRRS